MCEQKKAEEFGITEDDVSEIRQDINKFRFELVEILRKNRFDIGTAGRLDGYHGGRRAKQMERRILKGFNVDIHDLVKDAFAKQDNTKTVDIFKVMADAINKNSKSNKLNSQLNHIQFSNEETINYSPATITAAKKFKRSLGHKAQLKSETNGKRASQRKENGPTNNFSSKRTASVRKTPISNSRGGKAGNEHSRSPSTCSPGTGGAKDVVNTQMLNAAVIPCTITLNVPATENNALANSNDLEGKLGNASDSGGEGEADEEDSFERKQRLLERTAVRSLGRSPAIGGLGSRDGRENGGEVVQEAKTKLTSVRRANQVTSGWI